MNRPECTKNTAGNWLAKLMRLGTDAALSRMHSDRTVRSVEIIDYDINTYCKPCFIVLSIGVVKHYIREVRLKYE